MRSSSPRGSIRDLLAGSMRGVVSLTCRLRTRTSRSLPPRCITRRVSNNRRGCKTLSASGNFQLVKLKAIIGETEQEVRLELAGGRVNASIGARAYELEAREIEDGVYLMFVGNHVREVRVDEAIRIVDPKRLRSGQNSG